MLESWTVLLENTLRRGIKSTCGTPIIDAEPDKFHMLISRLYPKAEQLKKILDEGIVRLRASGKLDELKAKYEVYK